MDLRQSITNIIADGATLRQFVKGDDTVTIPVDGGEIPSLANLSKNAVSLVTASLQTASSTTTDIAPGTKNFTIPAGKGFRPGQWVTITNGDRAMSGTILSYTGTTLSINVTFTLGSGIYDSWTIYLSSPPGKNGADGTGGGGTSGPQETLITKFPWEQ